MTVIVYEKDNCMKCTLTKRYLDEQGIPYQTVKPDPDGSIIKLLIEHGFQSFPVVSRDAR